MINSPRNRGQSLIESLVVLVLIVVSVVSIIRLQNYLNYMTAFAQQRGDATLIATQQLETLRDFSVLNTTTGYIAYQDINSGSSNKVINGNTYTVTWTVTTNTSPAYKNLDVNVAWTDNYGATQAVRLIDNVANIDPATSNSYM